MNAKRVRNFILIFVAATALVGLTSCGGGNGARQPVITVVISSPTTSIVINGNIQFSAVVTNAVDTAVTWNVNGMAGGNLATIGSINAAGLYTAPAQVPSPATVTITAVSQQDNTTTSNSIVVTISASNNAGVVVSPATPVVPAGDQQAFTATENGNAIAAAFSVSSSSASCNIAACLGSFNGATYTAPLSPPPGGTVTITATAPDSTKGTTVATIQFSGASFNGQYAFNISGEDSNFQPLEIAGSFTAVGTPGSTTVAVTGGFIDLSSGTFGVLQAAPVTGGSFTVGATDGRTSGTITATGIGTLSLQLTLASNQHGLIIDFNSVLFNAINDTGSGTLDLQPQAGTFSLSSVQGNYSFGVSGTDEINLGIPLAVAGNFTANGGASTQGILDINDGGLANLGGVNPAPDTSLSVTYNTPDATTGRGTMILTSNFLTDDFATSLTFAFYVVNQNHLKLIEIDIPAIQSGDAFAAPSAPFSDATLASGNYAFTASGIRGSNTIQAFGSGGVFASDGKGNITGGELDFNDTSAQPDLKISATTYTVDPTFGRVNFALTTGAGAFEIAAYPTSSGSLEIITLDSKTDASGIAYLQQAPVPALQGNLAINLTGSAITKGVPVEQDTTGEVIAASPNLTGTLDINNVIATRVPPGSFNITASSFSCLDAFGRGTMTLKDSGGASFNIAFYLVSTASSNNGNPVPTVLLVDLDSNRVSVGELDQQF